MFDQIKTPPVLINPDPEEKEAGSALPDLNEEGHIYTDEPLVGPTESTVFVPAFEEAASLPHEADGIDPDSLGEEDEAALEADSEDGDSPEKEEADQSAAKGTGNEEQKTDPDAENVEKESKPKMKFSPSQQKVIDSRGKNLLVSASAGAGKTAVLVERLCRLVVDDHVPISSILAMTFTEDAAREMKTRLRMRLMEAAKTDPGLNTQVSALETASISTIHSFCLDLVQKYYYMAGLSYSTASHVDNDLADSQALEKAFNQAMLALDPKKSAELLLYMEAFSKDEKHLRERLLKFLELARSKPDPVGWMNSCRTQNEALDDWFFLFYKNRIQALMDIFETMVDAVSELEFKKIEKQQEYTVLFDNKIRALEECRDLLDRKKYSEFANAFVSYIETTGKFTPTINKVSFKTIQADSRHLEKEIAEVLFTEDQFTTASLQTKSVRNTFLDLAIDVSQRFAAIKREEGFIDFADMESYAWQILQNPAAADEIRRQYEVILIDEYQDTNDLQESIAQAICRDNNVFRVGDVKQSIYGFRQARVQLMKGLLEHPGKNDEIIAMQENYRSTARLIRFNNDFFSRLMNVDGLPPQFEAIDLAKPGTPAQSEGPQKPVRFLFTDYTKTGVPGADEEDGKKVSARSIHRHHRCDLIAHDIEQKVKAGEITLRDVAILTRSSTPHDELKQALEAWGIRAINHVRKGFYTNKAIQVVLSAMRVIEDEKNDIALMAVLASPLTGFTQQDILPIIQGTDPSISLYRRLQQSSRGQSMLSIVRRLKELKSLPLPQMVVGIFQIRGFYDYQTSSQDKTNLDVLLEKAVEADRLMDLEGFLESATLEEDLDKTSEATPFGREEDAVRISTIHASKGLQYKLVYILSEQISRDFEGMSPIQFDADLGLALESLDPKTMLRQASAETIALGSKRFVEEQQEKMRVLYVACTRAEKELVFVDSLKDEDEYSWDFDLRALLNNRGFTSWFFHMYHQNPGKDVVFERVDTLYERPARTLDPNRRMRIRRYAGPVEEIRSQTASAAKAGVSWPKVGYGKGRESGLAKERGTLFHEIVERVPYPYEKEAVAAYAKEAGLPLSVTDIDEITHLGTIETYARWMKEPHEFECPYCVMEEGAITHGYMDLVVREGNTIHILDFKTDRAFDEQSLASRYRAQLETYRRAMKSIEPQATVRAWIYSFALGSLFELS